ncbi:Ku protein [Flindersiella endophytica]
MSFGLVNVPVELFTATQQQDVAFHQFERETNERVRYKRVAEGTDREVDYSDVVKGYETAKGQYVMLDQEELEAADPGKSRSIDIGDFVELSQIDPIYYEKTYYLAPSQRKGDEGGAKAYALLRDAMSKAGLAGIGSFVMRGKEYLALIRPWKRVLTLETLYFADEVRDPEDLLDSLPRETRSDSRELKTAVDLVRQLRTDWEPEKYEDSYRVRLLEIIEEKAKGNEIHIEPEADESGQVIDLMEALQRSIDQAKSGGGSKKKQKQQGDGELGSLSKDELYEKASDLGVRGRSKMSRKQLEAAVSKAS